MPKDKIFFSCLLLLLTGIVLTVCYSGRPVHDFGNYYFGSRLAITGTPVQAIYEPYQFNQLVRNFPEMKNEKFLLNYAVVPPFSLLFFLPFVFTGVFTAKFLFNILSVFVFCLSLRRLLKHLRLQSTLLFLLPLLLFVPFRNNVLFGQTYLLLTGFLLWGFVAEEKNKSGTAAMFYSISIALKISPAIVLIYLLARKNYKTFFLTLSITALLFASPVYLTGWDLLNKYMLDYLPRMSVNEINNPYATNYQSIIVLLRNLFVPDLLLNPSGAFNSFTAFFLLSGLCTGTLLFFFGKELLSRIDHFAKFAFALFSSCLFTAYTSSYGLLFMTPLVICVIGMEHRYRMAILILIFLSCTVPVSALGTFPLLLKFPRLYLLLLVFMLYCSEHRFKFTELKYLAGCVVLMILMNFISLKKPVDQSDYFLDKEIALLAYDYELNENSLKLKFIDANGPGEKNIQLPLPAVSVQQVPLQLLHEKTFKLTGSGKEHLIKPLLVNKNILIYLSDRNRGIGFYALRKIPIHSN